MNKEEESTTTTNEDKSIGINKKEENIKNILQKEANYTISTNTESQKRFNYLSWNEYFMSVALLSSQRSKDPLHQVGACIVNKDKRIIGIGYNGFPRGCSDVYLPWRSNTNSPTSGNNTPETSPIQQKVLFMCHAEINAILNKCSADAVGATMYVTHFPCNECAKVIIQAGIQHVVYLHDTQHDDDMYRASRILFGLADVSYHSYSSFVGCDVAGSSSSSSLLKRIVLDWSQYMDLEEGGEEDVETDSTLISKEEEEISDDIKKLLLEEAGIDVNNPSTFHNNNASITNKGILNTHRKDYLTWDDYFLAIALLSAQRSKDPSTQVGACIVNTHNRIVGIGYNGFPRNCGDDILPWSRSSTTATHNQLHTKYPYVCHAEVNAVLNKCSHDLEDSKIYVALFPCNDCAKVIIQSGIREVVYLCDKYRNTDACRASRIMFGMSGVTLRQYMPSKGKKSFIVDFRDGAGGGASL